MAKKKKKRPPSDWLVLECPSCGGHMKVRKSAAESSRLLCPICKTVVSEPVDEPSESEETASAAATDHAEAPSVGEFGEMLPAAPVAAVADTPPVAAGPPAVSEPDLEFSGDTDPRERSVAKAPRPAAPSLVNAEFMAARQVTEDDEEEKARFFNRLRNVEPDADSLVRVKRRRRGARLHGVELTDWDVEGADLPEAEVEADTWLHPVPLPEEAHAVREREFVVGEVLEGGRVMRRIRRLRKHRTVTAAQRFFRRLSTTTRIIAGLLGGVIFLAAVILGTRVIRQRWFPVTQVAGAETFAPDRAFLTMQDLAGAEQAVRDFLAADTVERQLAFVRLPARVRPLMDAYYKDNPLRPRTSGEVVDQQKVRSGDLYLVTLAMMVNEPDPLDPASTFPRSRFFAVEEQRDSLGSSSYKVDWETAVQWQEMPLRKFKEEMLKTPVTFRLKMREGDYYLHGFSDREEWRCTELYYPGDEDFHLYGYIRLKEPAADRLLPLIEGGGRASVIVKLRYPDDAVSRDQVVVEDLVLDSWFHADDRPPADAASP